MVKCQYCKRTVTVYIEHPNVGRDGSTTGLKEHWMTYCEDCDVWSVIPMVGMVK